MTKCNDCNGKGKVTLLTTAETCKSCGGSGLPWILSPTFQERARQLGHTVEYVSLGAIGTMTFREFAEQYEGMRHDWLEGVEEIEVEGALTWQLRDKV